MIDDLLNGLKSVDPTTWGDIHVALVNILQSKDGEIIRRNPIEELAYKGIIQAGLQNAIEVRHLIWTVTKEDSQSDEAKAGTPYQAIIFSDEIDTIVDGIFRPSVTESLLAAYIEAVKHGQRL